MIHKHGSSATHMEFLEGTVHYNLKNVPIKDRDFKTRIPCFYLFSDFTAWWNVQKLKQNIDSLVPIAAGDNSNIEKNLNKSAACL